mgnify:CR=1 FL=1
MILRRDASNWAAYALGTSGNALVSDGTDAKWGTVCGGSGGASLNNDGAKASGAGANGFLLFIEFLP